MENKIKLLRSNIGKFLEFCKTVKAVPEQDLSKGYLEAKSQLIVGMWSKIDNTNDEIMETFTDEYEVTVGPEVSKSFASSKEGYAQAFAMFDSVTIHIHTVLEKLNKQGNPQVQPLQLPENLVLNTSNKSNIKLKSIDIPTFTGDYQKWISFKNMFDSLVHANKEFSDLQKIHYLKSCLSGEAERIVSQFDITDASYKPAYDALKDRFHNEVILVDTHIISILSQADLVSESSHGLKELMDVTTENLRALKILGIDTDPWDPILLLLLVQKLDSATRRLWEQNLKPKVRPTIKQFLDFLATRFHALGCQQNFKFSLESSSNATQQSTKRNFSSGNHRYESNSYKPQVQGTNFPPRIHQSFHSSSRRACPICSSESHSVFSCEKFREAEQRIRIEMVNRARLCQRCLRSHQSECNQREGCRVCGRNHHTFLHIDLPGGASSTQNSQSNQATNQVDGNNQPSTIINSHHVCLQRSPTATINSHFVSSKPNSVPIENNQISRHVIPWDASVLLATAIILIRSMKDNIFYPFRCLLDQGGEASHITESVVQRLGLNKIPITASMCGLGGVKVGSSNSVVEFEIGSKVNQYFTMNVQAVVVPKVTNPLPSTFIQRSDWKHIEGLRLADPEFYNPSNIDVILGTTVYGYLLLPGLEKADPNCPIAQNTELGWILSGATEPDSNLAKPGDHLETKSN